MKCGHKPNDEIVKAIEDYCAAHGEHYIHNIELFESEMTNGQSAEISGASYYTFFSHPEFVEYEYYSCSCCRYRIHVYRPMFLPYVKFGFANS